MIKVLIERYSGAVNSPPAAATARVSLIRLIGTTSASPEFSSKNNSRVSGLFAHRYILARDVAAYHSNKKRVCDLCCIFDGHTFWLEDHRTAAASGERGGVDQERGFIPPQPILNTRDDAVAHDRVVSELHRSNPVGIPARKPPIALHNVICLFVGRSSDVSQENFTFEYISPHR